MEGYQIIYDMVFDANFREIYKVFMDYLIDFQKVKPDKWVWYKNNVSEENGKKIHRANFLELIESWGNKQISYGYFELISVYCNIETPTQVKMYCSEKKYLGYWINIQYRLIENLKVFDGTLPEIVEPWMLIPDHGYDRKLLEYWHKGFTGNEIARKLYISVSSVYERLRILRDEYKEKIVPYRYKARSQN